MRFAAPKKLDFGLEPSSDGLWLAVDRASDALARFDERLKTSPVREGFLARLDFNEACAAIRNEGFLVHLEDLVLHDTGMDVRTPTAELVRAHAILRARRRLASAGPAMPTAQDILTLASERGDAELRREGEGASQRDGDLDAEPTGSGDDLLAAIDAVLARSAKSLQEARAAAHQQTRHPAVYDEEWDERGKVRDWLALVAHHDGKPAVLAAALAWESWNRSEPLQRSGFLGAMLVGATLRARGKAKSHLPALHGGARLAAMSLRRREREWPLAAYFTAIEAAAAQGTKELDRLTLAAEMLKRRCVGRRGNSKMPALANLFVESPIVTVPLAARRLKISQQAVTTMIDMLAPSLREITDRSRYRVWIAA